VKLTDTNIAKVRSLAKDKRDHIEWDEHLPGFGLRIRDGKATWVVQYKVGKLNRRITLGTVEQLTAEQARKGWGNSRRRAARRRRQDTGRRARCRRRSHTAQARYCAHAWLDH
jgi:Arm DNA-binding domain